MTRITSRIHSIDGLDHPFGIGIVPYVVEEGPRNLTLVDTCFVVEVPKLVAQLREEGYDITDVKRLVLTHTHVDHVQAANEVKRISGAEIYSHWSEAGYLKGDPAYHGPPTHNAIESILSKLGISSEEVAKKYGSLARDPVLVDHQLRDGDRVGKLVVVHTPGHTPGHISLFSEEDGAIIGGDFLFKGVLGFDGLFVPDSSLSIDPIVAAVSARRISQLKFDKLLLAHQDAPLLGATAPERVEQAAAVTLNSSSTKAAASHVPVSGH